jgi:excisionase family DNA binding protein
VEVEGTVAQDVNPNRESRVARRRLGSVRIVAAILAVPLSTAYALVRSGRLPGVCRIGRRIRVDLAELESWVAAGGDAEPLAGPRSDRPPRGRVRSP